MNTKKIGAASFAVVAAAGLLAGCGKSTEGESPVAFSPVTGDQFTANPGAFQTDGIAVPPKDVTMVGNTVAAQAVANSGLPQGTITSTSNNTTVYYPPAPAIPGVRPAPQPAPPAPMVRPANYRPWNYTQHEIEIYQQICESGSWKQTSTTPGGTVSTEVQTQTCYTLYGRQLGVRPWHPGQPRPWQRPDYPKPWFSAEFKVDVPVFWVYPPSWTQPRPQPLISVSIGLNIGNNPYRRVNPRFDEPFYPIWAVTPGRVVDARDQARVVAPIYTNTTTSTTTTVTAPVFPGVVLEPLPTTPKVTPVLAVPGAKVTGNVNLDASVTVPVAAALKGATIQAGTAASLNAAVGTSVEATVAKPSSDNGNRVTATGGAGVAVTGGAGAGGTVTGGAGAGGTVTGGAGAGAGAGATVGGGARATVPGGASAGATVGGGAGVTGGAATTTTTAPKQTPAERPTPAQEPTRTQTQEPTQTQTQQPTTEAPVTTTTPKVTPQAQTKVAPTQKPAESTSTCTPAQVKAGTCEAGN